MPKKRYIAVRYSYDKRSRPGTILSEKDVSDKRLKHLEDNRLKKTTESWTSQRESLDDFINKFDRDGYELHSVVKLNVDEILLVFKKKSFWRK